MNLSKQVHPLWKILLHASFINLIIFDKFSQNYASSVFQKQPFLLPEAQSRHLNFHNYVDAFMTELFTNNTCDATSPQFPIATELLSLTFYFLFHWNCDHKLPYETSEICFLRKCLLLNDPPIPSHPFHSTPAVTWQSPAGKLSNIVAVLCLFLIFIPHPLVPMQQFKA